MYVDPTQQGKCEWTQTIFKLTPQKPYLNKLKRGHDYRSQFEGNLQFVS